jgi:hypothetical protein
MAYNPESSQFFACFLQASLYGCSASNIKTCSAALLQREALHFQNSAHPCLGDTL